MAGTLLSLAPVAQLGERPAEDREAVGSSPTRGKIYIKLLVNTYIKNLCIRRVGTEAHRRGELVIMKKGRVGSLPALLKYSSSRSCFLLIVNPT
jgi:hypothetical protein